MSQPVVEGYRQQFYFWNPVFQPVCYSGLLVTFWANVSPKNTGLVQFQLTAKLNMLKVAIIEAKYFKSALIFYRLLLICVYNYLTLRHSGILMFILSFQPAIFTLIYHIFPLFLPHKWKDGSSSSSYSQSSSSRSIILHHFDQNGFQPSLSLSERWCWA